VWRTSVLKSVWQDEQPPEAWRIRGNDLWSIGKHHTSNIETNGTRCRRVVSINSCQMVVPNDLVYLLGAFDFIYTRASMHRHGRFLAAELYPSAVSGA
jgi:hypothetical protein